MNITENTLREMEDENKKDFKNWKEIKSLDKELIYYDYTK